MGLKSYGDVLPQFMLEQIVEDIEHAINYNLAGSECDVKVWVDLKEWAENKSENKLK